MRFSLLIAFALSSFWSCKSAKEAGVEGRSVQAAGETESPSEDWGLVSIDESGRPHRRLILSLDRVSGEKLSGALPECMVPLDRKFLLGEISCSKGAKISQPLLAGHVHQTCFTSPTESQTTASLKLILSGCVEARIAGFQFSPPIKIHLER